MFYLRSSFLLFVLLLLEVGNYAQKFEDKSYYLVDSLDLENTEEFELVILDSCIKAYHQSKSDLDKLDAILYLVKESYDQNIWPKYNQWLKVFVEKKLKEPNLSETEKSKYTSTLASIYNNEGYFYDDRGNFSAALQSYHKGLKISEKINDQVGMSQAFMNIGAVYHVMDNMDQALSYYEKSLTIDKELHDTIGIARTLGNIGIIYSGQGQIEIAVPYLEESIHLKSLIGDWEGVASTYTNIGVTYKLSGNPEEALVNYYKGLKILEELNDTRSISTTLYNIGNLYYEQDKFSEAEPILKKSLAIAQKDGFLSEVQESSKLLSRIYELKGNHKDALTLFKLYISTKDSINNEAALKASIELQTQYEYEKKVAADSVKNMEAEKVYLANLEAEKAISEKHKAENNMRKKQNIYLFIGLGILGLFGFFMFNRFKVTQRQKNIIDEQKKLVEEQKAETERQHEQLEHVHKEISDSINYAKRLQLAILPSMDDLRTYLKNGFVLFQPKDVVSGDFYWMQPSQDKVLFAAADCTGHGVPGAMVSVVCSNALNRVVKEFGIDEPKDVLNKTRELVIETFARSGKDVKDGMDIAICSLQGNELVYAGANNPLWIVRKTENLSDSFKEQRGTEIQDDYSLIDFKANKQPVGLYEGMEDFDQTTVELYQGDAVYIFTDGFADQFGGDKNKKLMYKPFKKLLIKIQHLPMDEQKEELLKFFHQWRGENEQIDDVCVIGVRIS